MIIGSLFHTSLALRYIGSHPNKVILEFNGETKWRLPVLPGWACVQVATVVLRRSLLLLLLLVNPCGGEEDRDLAVISGVVCVFNLFGPS